MSGDSSAARGRARLGAAWRGTAGQGLAGLGSTRHGTGEAVGPTGHPHASADPAALAFPTCLSLEPTMDDEDAE